MSAPGNQLILWRGQVPGQRRRITRCRWSAVNRVLLSLWLVGGVFYTANTVAIPHTTCLSGGPEIAAGQPTSFRPQAVNTPQAKSAQAQEVSALAAFATPGDVVATGSVRDQTTKTQVPKDSQSPPPAQAAPKVASADSAPDQPEPSPTSKKPRNPHRLKWYPIGHPPIGFMFGVYPRW